VQTYMDRAIKDFEDKKLSKHLEEVGNNNYPR
jgi:hypothetical protein